MLLIVLKFLMLTKPAIKGKQILFINVSPAYTYFPFPIGTRFSNVSLTTVQRRFPFFLT